MIGRILKTTYHIEGDDLIFDIYGRNENRKKFHLEVYGTEPYFFTEENPSHLKREPGVVRIEKSGKTLQGKKLWKVVTEVPSDVGRVREEISPHYEADIKYRNRVRFDNGWKQYVEYPEDIGIYTTSDIDGIKYGGEIEPRVSIADIEVNDKRGRKALDVENVTEPIESVALYDSYLDRYCVVLNADYTGDGYKEYIDEKLKESDMHIEYETKVTTVPTEKHLFAKLKEWFENTKLDIFTGWNFDNYDWEYIKNRSKKVWSDNSNWLKMPAIFDLMKGNDNITRGTTRNKLEVQAKRILGVGKLKTPPIHKMKDENKDLLVAYNLLDDILTKEISDYKGVMEHFPKLSELCGIDIDSVLRQSDIAEGYIFHKLHELADSEKEKVRLPSKEFVESGDVDVSGGYVGNPRKGLYHLVGVADFKSEYPSIIIEGNISPDTFVPKSEVENEENYHISPNGNYYQKEPEGIVPRIMRELLEERNEVKKKMKKAKAEGRDDDFQRLDNRQGSVKVVMNAFYGLIASDGSVFRLANKACSNDITAFAREHVKFTVKKLKEYDEEGYDSIYSDTDSVFFRVRSEEYEDIIDEVEDICEYLNSQYQEFCEEYNIEEHEQLKIEPDKIYERWLQGGKKKRYAGTLLWKDIDMRDKDFDDRMEVAGFETERSNTSKLTTEVQKKILKKVLSGEDKSNIRSFLKDLRNKVYDGEKDIKLGIEAEITTPPSEYKTLQAHVKSWQWAQENGYDLGLGDPHIWWYDESGDAKGIPLFEEEVPNSINIDYNEMWERNITKKLTPILECIVSGQFDMDMFLSGRRVKGLGSF